MNHWMVILTMFQLDSVGRWLIVIGLGIAVLGLLLFLLGKLPFLDRLGGLPGDLRFKSSDGRVTCLVPIVTSILLSILLTVLLNMIIRLLRH
jgi:hypothetical protein